jgi:hypothetical protein
VPARRLAVDDGPPRPAKPLDEIRAQFQQVEQEPIGAVSANRTRPAVLACATVAPTLGFLRSKN